MGLFSPTRCTQQPASFCFILSDSNAFGRPCLLSLDPIYCFKKQASKWGQSSWAKFLPPPWVDVNPDDLLRNSCMRISKLCLLPVTDRFIHTLFNCPSTCTTTGGGGEGEEGGRGGGDGRTNNLPLHFQVWPLKVRQRCASACGEQFGPSPVESAGQS